MIAFRDLSREVAELRAELEQALRGVLDEGRFVLGERVARFERAFAASCGAAAAVGVASGTDAIAIALRAVGVQPGDEVVTQANTCVPTVAGIEAAHAVPVLADADPATATLDPDSLAAVVSPRTRAVVPVHLYGQCADMDAIGELAREHGLAVVEDAAHAHGAEYRGRPAGSLGDAAAFSFYPTKNLGALGDAGALTMPDAALAGKAKRLRNGGQTDRYHHVEFGVNSRLDELQAAVLRARLPYLAAWTERRRALARAYRTALRDVRTLEIPPECDPGHVYHLFPVLSADRAGVQARLRDAGIETLIHYPIPIPRQQALVAERPADCPVADRICAQVLSLPLYPALPDGAVARVAATLSPCSAAAGSHERLAEH